MTATDQFLENDAAYLACGSVENDFQLNCSLYETEVRIDVKQTYPPGTDAQHLPIAMIA